MGSCLTLGNELSGDTSADRAKDFFGKGRPGGEQWVREPEQLCHMACSLGFYDDGISFHVVLSQSF